MRLGFAGTPEFSAQVLLQLLAHPRLAHLDWAGVLTQPGRPRGRGRHPEPSPVHACAQQAGLTVLTPVSFGVGSQDGQAAQSWLSDRSLDLLLVVAYGLLLPTTVLQTPRYGCVNVHTSLLPRWRGAAPIQRALQANDPQTGVCLMQMDAGLDTGPIWAQSVVPIESHDNFGSLSAKLLRESVALLVDLLSEPPFASQSPRPQPEEGVVYAHKIGAEDQEVVFSASAKTVFGRIRALDPSPAARTSLQGRPIKCGGASLAIESGQWGAPGEVLALPSSNHGLKVACGQGVIVLDWLQQAGGKRLSVQDFCRGHRVSVGDQLGH